MGNSFVECLKTRLEFEGIQPLLKKALGVLTETVTTRINPFLVSIDIFIYFLSKEAEEMTVKQEIIPAQ